MASNSAGILLYRHCGEGIAVLLVHPGGPYWAKKDSGAWSIPKGEYSSGEDPGDAALREFAEELGVRPAGLPGFLGKIVQKGGKHVTAFALEGELDVRTIVSNTFELEWPPRSGRIQVFPEVDRAEWFLLPDARVKLLASQLPLLDLLERLAAGAQPDPVPHDGR